MKKICHNTIICLLCLLFLVGCGGKKDSGSADGNHTPEAQFSKIFTDDDILKVELLGYGDTTETINELVLEVHYKGQLVDNAPFDDIILEILDSITGVESGMKLTVKLFALDENGEYQLKYTDWYMHMLFWMNSQNAEALQNYNLPDPNDSDKGHVDDTGTYSSWHDAYEKVLTVMQNDFPNHQYICNYSVFDIDKDNLPELLLKIGTCEADSEYRFYNYDKTLKAAMCFATTSGSHAVIGGLGDTQEFLIISGHQGYETIRRATYDGMSYSEEVVFDDLVQEYHTFDFLASYELNDLSGLQWNSNDRDNNSVVLETISASNDSTFASIEGNWQELDIENNGIPKSNGISLDVSYDSLEYSVFDISWGEEFENLYISDVTAFWGTDTATFSFLYDEHEATGTIYYRDGYIDLTIDTSTIPIIPVGSWTLSR